jgi:hypothetical protein
MRPPPGRYLERLNQGWRELGLDSSLSVQTRVDLIYRYLRYANKLSPPTLQSRAVDVRHLVEPRSVSIPRDLRGLGGEAHRRYFLARELNRRRSRIFVQIL